MGPPLERVLFGPAPRRRRVTAWVLAALALFAVTLAAYATGVFHIAGGLIIVPGQAALLALAAAGVVGYTRSGLAVAWLVAAGPLYGYRADHAFFGLSGRTRTEQLAYFLDLEGVAVVALLTIVVAAIGFVAGRLVRVGPDVITLERDRPQGGG